MIFYSQKSRVKIPGSGGIADCLPTSKINSELTGRMIKKSFGRSFLFIKFLNSRLLIVFINVQKLKVQGL